MTPGQARDVAIRGWLEYTKAKGATHMIVACDTFDHSDYPVAVMPGQDPKQVQKEYELLPMSRVMEVYSLTDKHTIDAQLAERRRVFHYD